MHVDKGKFNYFIFRLVLVGAPPLDAAAVRTPMSGVFEAAAKNEQKMKKKLFSSAKKLRLAFADENTHSTATFESR